MGLEQIGLDGLLLQLRLLRVVQLLLDSELVVLIVGVGLLSPERLERLVEQELQV